MSLRLVAYAGVLSLVGGLGCATGNPDTTPSSGGSSGVGGGSDECAGEPDGASCGDSGNLECDKPDTCLDGVCSPNLEADGVVCGDPTDTECDPADTCDGVGTCIQRLHTSGTACGDDTENACTDPDTCDAMGVCLGNHKPIGYGCGDSTLNECTGPDTCDGEGGCLTNDEPLGTTCGSAVDDQCTDPDACDGAGVCAPNDAASGTACGSQANGSCTNPDSCDGAGTCDDNHELLGVACGSPINTDCTDPDSCDGGGLCVINDAANGITCNDCPQGAGLCDGCFLGGCTDLCIPPLDFLTAPYDGGNGLNGVMFDIVAKDDIMLTRLETNLAPGTHTVSVYFIPGGMAGHETTLGDWTLVGTTASITSNSTSSVPNVPTEIPLDLNVSINNGQRYGLYIHSTSVVAYTNGTMLDDILVQNQELEIREGRGVSSRAFSTTQFFPRVFNGTVNYEISCP